MTNGCTACLPLMRYRSTSLEYTIMTPNWTTWNHSLICSLMLLLFLFFLAKKRVTVIP